ncbi:(deoxy)nucleoside triphosphate pyrophosphohydrolase [Nocardioides aurantiacus]|uniref:(deoxy)nucleoside triphosphate pyrophosphohydrolase n=1 Tax=Nocardioides aurantiacus TaxID=86796 RepID=UPI001FE77E4C|nr:(deoxy)nucleoside triphosphate pyrophosphohydrolase [Nocardioides aurantiacus]
MSVVGVAVRAGGRVLAARRTAPVALAGRWELPGGKVAPGETLEQAGVREVREELGCEVRCVGVLPRQVPLAWPLVLHVVVADLVDGEPVPQEHDAVRWLAADQLEEVGWLEGDRPFLDLVRGWL